MALARVGLSCGRYYLSVAGIVVAMECDPCRDATIPEEVRKPIPEGELATAMIGDRPAAELPVEVVRFFRGDRWTYGTLHWVADRINEVEASTSQDEKRSSAAAES